jgi:hypothetical protein
MVEAIEDDEQSLVVLVELVEDQDQQLVQARVCEVDVVGERRTRVRHRILYNSCEPLSEVSVRSRWRVPQVDISRGQVP